MMDFFCANAKSPGVVGSNVFKLFPAGSINAPPLALITNEFVAA